MRMGSEQRRLKVGLAKASEEQEGRLEAGLVVKQGSDRDEPATEPAPSARSASASGSVLSYAESCS